VQDAQESFRLDSIDRQLIALLTRDGRATNSSLAHRVGLAESTSLARIKRLKDLGVVRFTIEVDRGRLGRPVHAIVHIRLRHNARRKARRFYHYLVELPDLDQVHRVAGRYDFVIEVATADPEALGRLVQERISSHPSVKRTETHLVLSATRPMGTPAA
jgi:DNA-binding Lrp family transcriptional regulator